MRFVPLPTSRRLGLADVAAPDEIQANWNILGHIVDAITQIIALALNLAQGCGATILAGVGSRSPDLQLSRLCPHQATGSAWQLLPIKGTSRCG